MKSEAQKECELFIRPRKEIEAKIREAEEYEEPMNKDNAIRQITLTTIVETLKWVLEDER